MRITLRASALALATFVLLSNVPGSRAAEAAFDAPAQSQAAASIDVERIRKVLNLTPEQERYWAPVEAALRDLARRKTLDEPSGLVRRLSRRAVSVVLDSAAIRRLAAAARPLIAALDSDQRQAAVGLAREMGLGPVVAALY